MYSGGTVPRDRRGKLSHEIGEWDCATRLENGVCAMCNVQCHEILVLRLP
jgi:hypothetical protein